MDPRLTLPGGLTAPPPSGRSAERGRTAPRRLRRFYVGAPEPSWLRATGLGAVERAGGLALFVSHRRLRRRDVHEPARFPVNRHGGRPQRLLTAALAAAGRGWPVFPLHPGSKHPAVKAWESAATCDPVAITAWWAAAPYNIAIACGPAGLLVVDLDGPGEVPATWAAAGVQDGRGVLAALAGRAGAEDPTQTHTVATPVGEHRYFTVDPAQPGRSTVGALGWHVDTRARGGFVVAAGSTRTVAGRRHYYRTSNPSAPAAAPGWILEALTPPSRPRGPARPVGTIRSITAYAQAALDGEAAAVRDARPGTRNFLLFRAAARLGELVAADLIDESTVVLALQTAASRHIGTERFTTAEVDRAIANGLSRGLQHPRTLTTAAR